MSSAFFGAGSSTLPLFFQSASPTSAGFTPIERIPLAPSFGSYFPINPSSKRLRSICKDRSRDSAGFENDASDAGVSDEEEHEYWVSSPSASPYQILGIDPASCSPARLKSAFRARVKEFHPDVYKGASNSDEIILRVIGAYEILLKHFQFESVERSSDPFEEPESEAFDIFVNELLCIGKGCSYSCVKRAPYAFSFTLESGTARVVSQGHVDDYQVQLAVGQCPRKCIHYVTSSQRVILQDVLQRVLNNPFDLGEAAFLESLISKAILKNRRYQKPKRKPKSDAQYVDWS
ncbi:chaperone protein dnaJ C76, chloroplastic [Dendrobium catenatum]|uniref:chaperone protein dnaJ C76, chloroplastic n=1 Tax=Dendrobium catenatum TaxID=906689 RepID=UPI0009F54B0D|nr:chaperone protein dnaJ C76, chloroplastic [Dendrobium catenatum]